MTYTRPISASLYGSGLAGTLGYTVKSADGTTLIARTTSGITEDGTSGIYSASVSGWDSSWSGRIIWDAGAGTLAVEDFLYGPAKAGDAMTLTSAYATKSELLTQAEAATTIAATPVTLANGSITSSKFATITPGLSGVLERLMLLVVRFFPTGSGSVTYPASGNGAMQVRGANGTVIASQSVSKDEETEILGPAQ